MQPLFSVAVAIYIVFYVFEGVIRYGLHLVRVDALIFVRDGVLLLPMLAMFTHQALRRRLHPAFVIFIGVITLHGLVMLLNIGSVSAVAYGVKMLMTLVAGAIAARTLFQPSRCMLMLVVFLWAASWVGIVLDKYAMDVPWMGLETSIEDIKVEISRDWQITGADKRAGGFMRSSINAATIEPLLALMLIFHLRSPALRAGVAGLTVPALVWTTQKGPIVAYLFTLAFYAISLKRPIPWLRGGLMLMLVLCVALPLILPGYIMPPADGVFSFSSFYLRVEEMWPHGWQWISAHEAFPFGVGLGGISGAQRMYAPTEINAADNVFILMYAYFGVMSFVYLGFVALVAARTPNDAPTPYAHAMATLLFIFGYGCVISILEDQMASLFLGAALATLLPPPAGGRAGEGVGSTFRASGLAPIPLRQEASGDAALTLPPTGGGN